MPLGPKMGTPRGHMFYISLYRVNMKQIFLSETRRPRVPILDMQRHLMDLYQDCSHYAHWAINGPAHGCMLCIYLYRKVYQNKYSCLKPQGLELWYVAFSSRTILSLFKLCPWAKSSPTLESHVLHWENMKIYSCLKPQGIE